VHCSHSLLSDIHHRRLLRLFALPYLAPRLEALADPLAHVATWGVAVAVEIVLLALSLTIYVQAHADSAVDSIKMRAYTHMTDWENGKHRGDHRSATYRAPARFRRPLLDLCQLVAQKQRNGIRRWDYLVACQRLGQRYRELSRGS
jgi:hypothetical protein